MSGMNNRESSFFANTDQANIDPSRRRIPNLSNLFDNVREPADISSSTEDQLNQLANGGMIHIVYVITQ